VGIGFLLFIYGVAGLVFAAIASAYLQHRVEVHTRGGGPERSGLLRFSALLPFACLVWAGIIFLLQAWVNTTFLDRDPGLGDFFQCPLANGWVLRFIDVVDFGLLCRAKGPSFDSEGAVENVRRLQLAGRYALGATDSRGIMHSMLHTRDIADGYFLLDMVSGGMELYSDDVALRDAAQARGIRMKLESIYVFYRRNRWGWFDVLVLILLGGPPVLAWVKLMGRARRAAWTT
jgi:hypothetical protein